ncbi:MAG: hypothetical protein M1306_02700 [Candidatus Thermoplasmatota archaeon]|nr:hypothetical protein [Candidatus Thermoplasmatota archaeon]
MKIFLAVDGGATKTMAAVFSEDLEILGIGLSGPSNYRNVGEANAIVNIKDACIKAFSMSGIEKGRIDSQIFSIAGVGDSDMATKIVRRIVDKTGFAEFYDLYNDGEAGFYSRFLEGDGIIIAAGTGLISIARYQGRSNRASGWGWLVGDEGGAFYIGMKAISAFSKISDHRMDFDADLISLIKERFQITKERDIINIIYTNPVNIRRIASIASGLSDLANHGNTTAREIIRSAAKEAALNAPSLYRYMRMTGSIRLSGYGGVYRAGDIYWNTIKKAVRSTEKNIDFKKPVYGYHAVAGSIALKALQTGISIDEKDLDKLIRQVDLLIPKISEADRKEYLFMP